MPPPRETILTALHARLSALPATALRGDMLPERIPADGLLILRDGEAQAVELRALDALTGRERGHQRGIDHRSDGGADHAADGRTGQAEDGAAEPGPEGRADRTQNEGGHGSGLS